MTPSLMSRACTPIAGMMRAVGLATWPTAGRADSTLLGTFRELRDVDADSLTRDLVGIASRGVQPTEEVREANRVSALRVDRTIAQAQLR